MIFRKKRYVLAFFFVCALISFGFSFKGYADDLKENAPLSSDVEEEQGLSIFAPYLLAGHIEDIRLNDVNAIKHFYKRREDRNFWISDGGLFPHSLDFIKIIEDSWTHGLNPDRYHLAYLRGMAGNVISKEDAKAELLLTDAYIRYVQDLTGVRVNLTGLRTDPDSWLKPLTADSALSYLNEGKDISGILERFLPKSRTYQSLRAELVRLSMLQDEQDTSYLPIISDVLMKPGRRHASIPFVRKRLDIDPQTSDPLYYDDELAAAIMRFQAENKIVNDGIIGSNTLHFLNMTRYDQMLQIIANLERLRWLTEEKPKKYIVVNIPSATMWAVDSGDVIHQTPVILGSVSRPTTSFVTKIQGVRFNPDWTIPNTIKILDIIPKIIENPDYLTDKNIELYDGFGRGAHTLDPASIDWKNITKARLNNIRMVQKPGRNNPLGLVRVLMPNKYDIYLHDTNHPEYFEHKLPWISSGCIRMKAPIDVANFIMQSNADWNSERMQKLFDSGGKTDIRIDDSIMVYILYYTVWVGDSGEIEYGPDVYYQDKKLLAKLYDIDGLPDLGQYKR